VAFLVVFAVGSLVSGFGMGVPELTLLVVLAGVAFLVASTRRLETDSAKR
jgi:hypothetical protein